MIKCIFREPDEGARCNLPADYIIFGASFCTEHFEIRTREAKEKKEAVDKEIEKLKKQIKD